MEPKSYDLTLKYPLFQWRNNKILKSTAVKRLAVITTKDKHDIIFKNTHRKLLADREKVLFKMVHSLDGIPTAQRHSIRKQVRRMMKGRIDVVVKKNGSSIKEWSIMLGTGESEILRTADNVWMSKNDFEHFYEQNNYDIMNSLKNPDETKGETEIEFRDLIVPHVFLY